MRASNVALHSFVPSPRILSSAYIELPIVIWTWVLRFLSLSVTESFAEINFLASMPGTFSMQGSDSSQGTCCFLPTAQPLVPTQNHKYPFLGPLPSHIEFLHSDTWVFHGPRTQQKVWVLFNEISHSIPFLLGELHCLKNCLVSYIPILLFLHIWVKCRTQYEQTKRNVIGKCKRTEIKSRAWDDSKQQWKNGEIGPQEGNRNLGRIVNKKA